MEIITEIGINHNGSMKIVKKMIDDIVKIRNDTNSNIIIKFQKRNPDICVPEEQKNKEKIVPWRKEPTTYIQYKKDIEFGEKEYTEIDKYCKKKNINWSASAWDIDSLNFISKFDVPFIKIPSAKITDLELLKASKEIGIPIYISTGMSTEKEIETAVTTLGTSLKVIFHCNSSYPAKDYELNLNYITELKKIYPDKVIGYSGHEKGIIASIIAVSFGVEVIERHVTLDKSNWGTDQLASLDFKEFKEMVIEANKVNDYLGNGIKKIYESELKIRNKLR